MNKESLVPIALRTSGIQPFPYQWEGIKTLAEKLRFLLRDDPGLGKTIQLIVAANAIAVAKDRPLDILVICPKTAILNWYREAFKWGMGDRYTVINPRKLIGKDCKNYLKKWDIVIADESHQFLRNRESKQAIMFLQILERTEILWLATATPANTSAEDYYLSFRMLLPEMFNKISRTEFVQTYCNRVESEFFSKTQVRGCKCVKIKDDLYKCIAYSYTGFKNVDKLNKILSLCSLRRVESEVNLQLPELTYTDYLVDVENKKLFHFSKEEADDITERVMRGQDFGQNYHAGLQHNAFLKIPTILDLLNGYPASTKVVIFAWHVKVVEEIVKEIKENTSRKVDFINGSIVDITERQKIIDDFQEGDTDTLVLNMESGGASITLTAATIGIYAQFPTSAIQWRQSRKRIHRIGSKKPVQIIKLIIPNSIDKGVFEVLDQRLESTSEVEG